MIQSVVIAVEFDGTELRRRRLAAGWGYEKFAKLLGTRRDRVWKWETGCAAPSEQYLARITKLLGCEPDDLYRVVE